MSCILLLNPLENGCYGSIVSRAIHRQAWAAIGLAPLLQAPLCNVWREASTVRLYYLHLTAQFTCLHWLHHNYSFPRETCPHPSQTAYGCSLAETFGFCPLNEKEPIGRTSMRHSTNTSAEPQYLRFTPSPRRCRSDIIPPNRAVVDKFRTGLCTPIPFRY